MVRAKAIVTGVVQGVGFRYYAARLANQYNVTGYAKNLPNGAVEIDAEGDRPVVSAFLNDIRIGPRLAHVSDMQIEWLEPKDYRTFSIY